ncbi:MAG TPA: hypothetical protein VMH39_12350 [Gemmatimonadaceae bacterium]|nr:hypothetical protein [Gemmatimonadaceae bacterium]
MPVTAKLSRLFYAKMDRRFTEQNRWLVGTFATMILGFTGLGLGMIGLWLRR